MWPLSLIRFKKAVGVVVEGDRIVAATVAATIAGPQVLKTQELEFGEDGVRGALSQLTEKLNKNTTIFAGLPAHHVYFATKPAPPGATDESLELLPQTLSGGSKYVHDSVGTKQRKRTYRSIGACKRDLAREVMAGLEKIKPTRVRLEPAPFALHAYAGRSGKVPRRWKTLIRVLVDGPRGIAFLVQRGRPLAWRPFQCEPGQEATAVAVAARGLRAYGRGELDLPDVEGILLHNDSDAEAVRQACEEEAGIETRALKLVPLDTQTAAASLGQAGLKAKSDNPDLLAKLKPPPSIRDIFPWGVAALLTLAVLGGGYQLNEEADLTEARIRTSLRSMRLDAKKAKVKVPLLKKRHKELALEMQLIYTFIVERVSWARVLAELPGQLPDTTVLYGVRGRCSFAMPSNQKSGVRMLQTKELSLQGRGRLERGKAAPEEIHVLLEALAANETITKDFPRVDGANVSRKPGKVMDAVSFVARCSRPTW